MSDKSIHNIVESLDTILNKVTNNALDIDKDIKYNMLIQYRSHWGVFHALREFISNARDAVFGNPDDWYVITDNKKHRVYIIDRGPGMTLEDFYLGGSSSNKKGENTVGRFHEGLKIASVVMVRNNIPITIIFRNRENGDYYVAVPKSILDSEIRKKVLGISIYRLDSEISNALADLEVGTAVIIDLSRNPQYTISSLNIDKIYIKPNDDRVIYRNPKTDFWIIKERNNPSEDNKIYVLGIYISDFGKYGIKTVFSYNFGDLNLEESRSIVNVTELKRKLLDELLEVDNEEVWKTIFKNGGGCLECELNSFEYRKIKSSVEKAILNALKKVYGENVVILTHGGLEAAVISELLSYRGYNVVSCPLLKYIAENSSKLPTSHKVLEELRKIEGDYTIIDDNDITDEETLNKLQLARNLSEIVAEMLAKDKIPVYAVKLSEIKKKLDESNGITTLAFYDPKKRIIGIEINYLQRAPSSAIIGTMMEEFAHGYLGIHDEYGRNLIDGIKQIAAIIVGYYQLRMKTQEETYNKMLDGFYNLLGIQPFIDKNEMEKNVRRELSYNYGNSEGNIIIKIKNNVRKIFRR